MARTGNFGRAPRSAPSLQSIIFSVFREQERQREQNLMDSWEKGGTFEGKKTTDSMVLAFWKQKMKLLAKDDPLLEGYKDTVLQLEYGIAQSKADLLHVQGKMSDSQYAQFFLNWAKKVPKDSEFYRTLQKQAAQLNEQAKSRGRASAAQAKADAFSSYADGIAKSHISLGDTMISVMTQIARDNNLIGRDEDLTKFMLKGQDDPAIMEDLLKAINSDMAANPAKYKDLTSAIKKLDPHWNGQLTSGYFARTLKRQEEGYTLIETRANKDGYSSYAKDMANRRAGAHELGIESKAWGTGQTYTVARDAFDAVMDDPKSTSADKVAAADLFANQLTRMAANKDLDASFKNRLLNDAAALRGEKAKPQPSFNENFLGLKGGTAGTASTGGENTEGGDTKGEIARWQKQQEHDRKYQVALEQDPNSFVYASVKEGSDPPVFDPSGKGAVGVVTRASVEQSPQQTAVVPTITKTGQTIMVAQPVHDIYVTDPVTGKKGTESVGKTMEYTKGGTTVTLYGRIGPDGKPSWTAVSPFAAGVTETKGADGNLTLSVTGLGNVGGARTASGAASLDADVAKRGLLGGPAGGFAAAAANAPEGTSWTLTSAPRGKGKAGDETTVTVSIKGGQLVTSETTSTYDATGNKVGGSSKPLTPAVQTNWNNFVYSKSREIAGFNPTIDFDTPAMAAVTANGMTQDQVQSLWVNPQFQVSLQAQEMEAAGNNPVRYAQISQHNADVANAVAQSGPETQWSHEYVPAAQRKDLMYPNNKGPQYEEHSPMQLAAITKLTLPQVPQSLTNPNGSALSGPGGVVPPTSRGYAPMKPVTPTTQVTKTATGTTVTPTPTATPTATPTPTPTPMPVSTGTLLGPGGVPKGAPLPSMKQKQLEY